MSSEDMQIGRLGAVASPLRFFRRHRRSSALIALVASLILSDEALAAGEKNAPRIIVAMSGKKSGVLIGAWRKGHWLRWKAAAKLHRAGTAYALFGRRGHLGRTIGGKPALDMFTAGAIRIAFPGRAPAARLALSSAPPNAYLRKPAPIAAKKHHQAMVRKLLRSAGMKSAQPVKIRSAWRVDLDGDGREEELIAAIHPRCARSLGDTARAGDFALTAIRTVDGKAVLLTRYLVVAPTRKSTPPEEHGLYQLLNIDGQPGLEIVIKSEYYEGWGYDVFSYARGRAKKVLSLHDGL